MLKDIYIRLAGHHGFLKYLINTSWMFAEQILRMFAGLLVGIYVARYLGPEKLGLLNYALAFVALFAAVAKMGLDGIVVRELVNFPDKRDAYLGSAFWLKVCGIFITWVAILVGVMNIDNDNTTKLYIGIIAGGLIFQSFEVVDFYFQSRVLSKYVSLCKIAQLIISSLVKLYLVAANSDLVWFVLVTVIDQASLAIALAYAYLKQNIGSFYFKFNLHVAKDLLLNARPLIISGILVSIYASIDRLIIKEMLGIREVGLYVVATGLTGAFYVFPMLMANSLFPAILNAKKLSENTYRRRLSLLYKNILFVGAVVSVSVCFLAPLIIDFLYGIQFSASATVLQIYIWNFMVICFSSIFGKWLLSENLQHIAFKFNLMAIVINVVGCWLFIQLWSIKGAAVAALLAQIVPLVWFGITNKEVNSQLKIAFSISSFK